MFNRETFFEVVRSDPFGGSLIQDQVDGMNYILDTWEDAPPSDDLRWLAYALATTYHETAATMLPIAEYGYGGSGTLFTVNRPVQSRRSSRRSVRPPRRS